MSIEGTDFLIKLFSSIAAILISHESTKIVIKNREHKNMNKSNYANYLISYLIWKLLPSVKNEIRFKLNCEQKIFLFIIFMVSAIRVIVGDIIFVQYVYLAFALATLLYFLQSSFSLWINENKYIGKIPLLGRLDDEIIDMNKNIRNFATSMFASLILITTYLSTNNNPMIIIAQYVTIIVLSVIITHTLSKYMKIGIKLVLRNYLLNEKIVIKIDKIYLKFGEKQSNIIKSLIIRDITESYIVFEDKKGEKIIVPMEMINFVEGIKILN
ncbi:MAG: hypothetical protein J7K83_01800 [Candidatus Aenigmarchaeota archaeon]|nr:hypothetical protein [Candidatus Aenigmarchaeota archaeon]